MQDRLHFEITLLMQNYFWPERRYPKAITIGLSDPLSLQDLLEDFELDVLAAAELDPTISQTRDSIDQTIQQHRLEALVSPVAWIRTRARQL